MSSKSLNKWGLKLKKIYIYIYLKIIGTLVVFKALKISEIFLEKA